MLYREIIAVCSQIHTTHINTLCGQNGELLDVNRGGTYSNWSIKDQAAVKNATTDAMCWSDSLSVIKLSVCCTVH